MIILEMVKNTSFKAEILEILIERELKNCAGNNKPDRKELELFVDRVCKMIKDESIKLSGNDKLVQYDFRMKRLALFIIYSMEKQGMTN